MPEDYLSNPNQIKRTIMDPEWVKSKSKDELIQLVLAIGNEIYNQITERIVDLPAQLQTIAFEPVVEAQVSEYLRLPQSEHAQTPGEMMRAVFVFPDTKLAPLGVEICGEVIVGRDDGEGLVDLDLTQYYAGQKGVSRRHAILKPIGGSLFIIDTGSVNGTYVNGEKSELGVPAQLNDEDIISLGMLHIKLKMVDH